MSSLPAGWRIKEIVPELDPMAKRALDRHLEDVKQVAKELSAIPRRKREVPNTWQGKSIEELTQEEREAFHFSLQAASTQSAITAQKTRKPEDDIDHLLRPMPLEQDWKRDHEIKRDISPEEFMLHKSIQRSEKNIIGQSDKGSVDSEKRQKGIEAFTYSKPAVLTQEQIKKLTKLQEIINTPLEPEANEVKKKRRGIFGAIVDAIEFVLPPN